MQHRRLLKNSLLQNFALLALALIAEFHLVLSSPQRYVLQTTPCHGETPGSLDPKRLSTQKLSTIKV